MRPASLSTSVHRPPVTSRAGSGTPGLSREAAGLPAATGAPAGGRLRVGVLALQGDVAEHVSALAELGARPVEVRRPSDLFEVEALVLPGGESTTMSLLLDSSELYDPLAHALRQGMPAFGTCAGMILLAAGVLDGRGDQRCFSAIDISVRRNAFGRQKHSFECDLEVAGLDGGPMRAVFIRAPAVERAGPGVEVLATVEVTTTEGSVQRPVVCCQGSVLVSAFHPELSDDLRLHQLFLSRAGRRLGLGKGRSAVPGSHTPVRRALPASSAGRP